MLQLHTLLTWLNSCGGCAISTNKQANLVSQQTQVEMAHSTKRVLDVASVSYRDDHAEPCRPDVKTAVVSKTTSRLHPASHTNFERQPVRVVGTPSTVGFWSFEQNLRNPISNNIECSCVRC